MPTYEYQCKKCGCHFERFQKISDTPVEICPQCGGNVQKIISKGAGFIFKGSGFYATDYKDTKPDCGRENTCCGQEVPCESKLCNK